MTNFITNTKDYQKYAQIASSAENLIFSDSRSSLIIYGTFAEQLTKEIFRLDGVIDWELNQKERIDKLARTDNDYPVSVLRALDEIRRLRNKSAHDDQFNATKKMALEIDKQAYLVWSWFLQVFSTDKLNAYVPPVDQNKVVADQQALIDKLKAQLEAARKNTNPVKVNSEQREKRRKINLRFAKNHELSEAETREMIDEQLRKAGWEVDTDKLNNYTRGTLPKKGKNMAIAEWVLANKERADYALFVGEKLVGIVEAKKWDQDISGQLAQPKEYSRKITIDSSYELVDAKMGEYKVPFIYTANGRPYVKQFKEKSGIWFWDARNPEENSYALEQFHSPEDLELKLTAKSKKDADQDLINDTDFPEFADRDYQIKAVQKMEAAIDHGQKRILLVMATGTGKTRTAISLMYRLLKHKRARRILYLVDRNSLGKQTANAIKNNKIGNTPVADIYGMKELADKLPEASTKIQIATVQGMIKRLFYNDDSEVEKLSVGMYDFIIVDEAHRGYAEDREMTDDEYRHYYQEEYISQYRRVVDYFDATAIGMTATPALQTTEIFGHPVFTYSYQEAVLSGYLVDHDAPHIIKTELSQKGIHLKKGSEVSLFDPNNENVETESLPDNVDFDVKDFNTKVITPSFNKVVADELAKDLDPTDKELGKTLIFAATDSHADMVVNLLKQAFKDADNPVPDDAIEKITGSIRHPDEEIRRFKNEQYPNIVVTVDLLTTGIDVPSICNIVFLRQVHSRILYEQMLGRATRLCPKINKDKFQIYDAVGIYDAMNKVTNMKPVVKGPHHNVKYFLDHKKDYFEVSDNITPYQIDMSGAIERKIKLLNTQEKKDFERLEEIPSIDKWAANLSKLSKDNFMNEWPKFEKLGQIHPKINRPKQYISDAQDKLVGVERGYGNGMQDPGDYIQSFNNFIRNNMNEIPALNIISTKPKDLTYEELKQIQLTLEQNGYKKSDLQTAWKSANHVQTTADIISFIRQASLGSPLVDHETRIHNAMQKVYSLSDWSEVQKKWLSRIENQLLASDVLGPTAQQAFDDNFYFKRQGGYKRMKKIFPRHAEDIINMLNNNLYA